MEAELLLNALFLGVGAVAGVVVGWLMGVSEGIRLADLAREGEWRELMD